LALKGAAFGEITQNSFHYAVKGHSKSPLSILIESPYAIFYVWIELTYVLSLIVSALLLRQWRAPVCTHVSKRNADTSNTDVSV